MAKKTIEKVINDIELGNIKFVLKSMGEDEKQEVEAEAEARVAKISHEEE